MLLAAALLSSSALVVFVWRLVRLESDDPVRRVGELRVAQWAALLLAARAAIPIGLAVAGADQPLAHLDAAIGIGFAIAAGGLLLREPRQALGLAAAAFLAHALVDAAHRPGWLAPDLAPRWMIVGGATYDLVMAALCFRARRG